MYYLFGNCVHVLFVAFSNSDKPFDKCQAAFFCLWSGGQQNASLREPRIKTEMCSTDVADDIQVFIPLSLLQCIVANTNN